MRKQILDTALEQFLTYGIRDMSIIKLVTPLGISTKTVYKYFKNKEELLEEVLDLYYEQQYQLLKNLTANQQAVPLLIDIWYWAVAREYTVNNKFFHDLRYYYPELNTKKERTIGVEIWKRIGEVIRKGIQDEVFLSYISPLIVLEGLSVLYTAVTRTEAFEVYEASLFTILMNTMIIYIRGFCTSKGMLELEDHVKTLGSFGEPKAVKQRMKKIKSKQVDNK